MKRNLSKELKRGCFFLGLVVFVSVILTSLCLYGQSLEDLTRWQQGRSMWTSSACKGTDGLPDPNVNKDSKHRVEPGQTVIIADLTGPGIINHIWMTIYLDTYSWARKGWSPDGTANPQEVLIRMYWDGRTKPDVEAPLGDFFAYCFGKQMEVISAPVVVEDGDSYNCYWQMPFRKSARIEVINQSTKPIMLLYYNVDWVKKDSLPENTMYFCAQYRQEYPVKGNLSRVDSEYLILDAKGKGYYVGTVLAVRTRSPAWFGEGDMRISIDGEARPSLWGTGTEDYFLSAWGLKETSTPYFGVPFLNQRTRNVGQMTCCYRWHIHDPLVFNESIRVAIETMSWLTSDENAEGHYRKYGQRQDDYSSVAFWYQMGPSKKFTEVPPAQQRKLPNIERIILWGKDYIDKKYHGAGRTNIQKGALWNESGGQLLFRPDNQKQGWVDFSFEVKEKEPLRLVLELTRSNDSGIYQPILNGVKLRDPIDLYKPDTDLWEFHIMDFWPDPGKYTLRLQCVGKNRKSDNYYIGINSIRLRERLPHVKALEYDKDKDWRKQQRIYMRARKPAAPSKPKK